ncbi:MAG: tetratricopeptide repeat protein [Myxococcota bacterium]|nr:tetratricopeptide repeat protein [Myxococcota bacterium]
MPSRRRPRIVALLACMATASATGSGHADTPSATNAGSAREHFDRARALYSQGAYREAIAELEAAHDVDPDAKDLVFNLGLIYEKLADIDGALRWFRLYTTMNLTAAESTRVDAFIHRLEGARREIEPKEAIELKEPRQSSDSRVPAAGLPSSTVRAPSLPLVRSLPSAPLAAPAPGRIDGWTVSAAGVCAVSLAFGIVLAVKAVQDQPPSNTLTQPTGPTYSDLVNRVETAHTEAMLADVGFGAALVSAVAAAYLYFARPGVGPAGRAPMTVSAAPVGRNGGMLSLKGTF